MGNQPSVRQEDHNMDSDNPWRKSANAPTSQRATTSSRDSTHTKPGPAQLAAIVELIQHIYFCANLPIPDETLLMRKAMHWAKQLADVPLCHLFAAYERAARNHTGQYPVNAYEIYQGWKELAGELVYRRRVPATRHLPGPPGIPLRESHTLLGVLAATAERLEGPARLPELLEAVRAVQDVNPDVEVEEIRQRANAAMEAGAQTLAAVVAALTRTADGAGAAVPDPPTGSELAGPAEGGSPHPLETAYPAAGGAG
jgi:hypothetical protein